MNSLCQKNLSQMDHFLFSADDFHIHSSDSALKITYKPFHGRAYGIAILHYCSQQEIKQQNTCPSDHSLNSLLESFNGATIPVLEEVFLEIESSDRYQNPMVFFKECRDFYASLYYQISCALHEKGYPFFMTHLPQEDEKDLLFFGLWSFIFRHFCYNIKTWGGVWVQAPCNREIHSS
jgi:hypothetical protein